MFAKAGLSVKERPFKYSLPRGLGLRQLSQTAQPMPAVLNMFLTNAVINEGLV